VGEHPNHIPEVCSRARGQVHSIWKYIESLPIWAQLTLFLGFLASLGLNAKELAVTSVHLIRGWIEHQRIKKVVNFLALQVNPEPRVPNGRGHTPPSHIFCKSFQIAGALGMSPLMVLRLLEKLKTEQRVEQQGTLDSWKISKYEIEHRKFRNRK
jgi:hypothetical protein